MAMFCTKCEKMHRRAQAAESLVNKLNKQLDKLTNGINTWKSPERQKEAAQRDHMAEVIQTYGSTNANSSGS